MTMLRLHPSYQPHFLKKVFEIVSNYSKPPQFKLGQLLARDGQFVRDFNTIHRSVLSYDY